MTTDFPLLPLATRHPPAHGASHFCHINLRSFGRAASATPSTNRVFELDRFPIGASWTGIDRWIFKISRKKCFVVYFWHWYRSQILIERKYFRKIVNFCLTVIDILDVIISFWSNREKSWSFRVVRWKLIIKWSRIEEVLLVWKKKKEGEENRLCSFLSSVTNYIWTALSLSFTPFSGNDVTEVVAGRMIQFIYTPFKESCSCV